MIKFIFTGLFLFSLNLFAEGGVDHVGSGGDICENRFILIRDDLNSWILKGGAKDLILPKEISLETYTSKMLQNFSAAKFSCTNAPLFVGATEKTCKNFAGYGEDPSIVCNRERFMQTDQSDQYVLVHHEYAGLSGFEANTEETSHYEISNQIVGYLESKKEKKLVVKNEFNPEICKGPSLPSYYDLLPQGIDTRSVSHVVVGTFNTHARQRACQDTKICSGWSKVANGLPLDPISLVPDHGGILLDFAASLMGPTLHFLAQRQGQEKFYFSLDCGLLSDFKGTCKVRSNFEPLSGNAYGKILDHCSWFLFSQRTYKNKNSWLEQELVVTGSY